MKLTLPAKIGLVLATLGLIIFVSIAAWQKAIRTTLVDIPIPIRAGETVADFSVDYDGPIYTMEVQFDRSVSEPIARCLLGEMKSELHPDINCTNIEPLLKFSWELRRDGQMGGMGSSADLGTRNIRAADGTLSVVVFGFPAQKKHRYQVVLKLENDASRLDIPPPRVRIGLDSFVMEDNMLFGAAVDAIAFVLCLVGVSMFVVSVLRAKFKRSKTPA